VDKALNKPANITITSSSGLSKEEIEKAKKDAELHAEEDEKRFNLVNKKNQAESLCNSIERALKEAGDKLADDDKKPVNDKISEVREALKSDDVSKIDAAVEAMNKAYEPVVTKLYPAGANGASSFKPEDFEKMKNDPRFAEMFKSMSSQQANGAG